MTDEYGSMIAMVVGKYDGNEYIKAGEIGLAINKTGDPTSPYETKAYINADHVNISATQTAYSLAGDMEHDANGKLVIKSAGGMYVQRTESGVTSQFGVFDNGNLTAGVIATKVNGETSTHIYADNIVMSSASGAQTVKVAIDGKLTTSELESQIALLSAVRINTLNITTLVDSPLITGTEALIDDISCDTLSLSGGDSFSDCLVDAEVSGNVLTLTYASGDTVTFSKATILSPLWNSGTFTVTASPQGDSVSTGLFSVAAADITWNGNVASFPVYANLDGGETRYNTGKTLSIDASNIYTNGYNDGYPSGTITIGSKITGSTYNVSISPTSGTAKATTKDFSSIYADARDGYTQGTFTLASVTLQGSQVSGTCYHTVPTGGTVYYTAGSSVTTLGSSVTPTSVSGYRRGSSVSMSRDTIYRKGTGGTYTEIGYCYYCQSSSGASTLYKGGDYFNYHDVGTSSTLYYAGSSVTQISGGGVRLSTVTAYSAGSTVSDTYYTKS